MGTLDVSENITARSGITAMGSLDVSENITARSGIKHLGTGGSFDISSNSSIKFSVRDESDIVVIDACGLTHAGPVIARALGHTHHILDPYKWEKVTMGSGPEDLPDDEDWRAIALSGDGTRIVVVGQNTYPWTSSDAGASWTEQRGAPSIQWRAVCCNYDGDVIIASSNTGSNNLWRSVDYGVTWSQPGNSFTNRNYTGLGMEKVGNTDLNAYMGAISGANSYYVAKNAGGGNWESSDGDVQPSRDVAVSADGTKIVIVANNELPRYNGGTNGQNWAEDMGYVWLNSSVGQKSWRGVTSTSNGQIVYAVAEYTAVWKSTNYGADFEATTSPALKWQNVTTNETGTKVQAVDYETGEIWQSLDSGATWAVTTIDRATPAGGASGFSDLSFNKIVSSKDGGYAGAIAAPNDSADLSGSVWVMGFGVLSHIDEMVFKASDASESKTLFSVDVSGKAYVEESLAFGTDIVIGSDASNAMAHRSIAIGYQARFDASLSYNAIAIGTYAGETDQSDNAIAIGRQAGHYYQSANSVAIGSQAGYLDQSHNAVSIGFEAGTQKQGAKAVAIGYQAGKFRQDFSAVAIGPGAGWTDQSYNAVAVGSGAGNKNQGHSSVAVGFNAGKTRQDSSAVAIGADAGEVDQSSNAVAIGTYAGRTQQKEFAVAIGLEAGNDTQGQYSIAVGRDAGKTTQGNHGVAIGHQAGNASQGEGAVAIGRDAGNAGAGGQGDHSVAIGRLAGGSASSTQNNTIILNATGALLDSSYASSFYVKPIREFDATDLSAVLYNSSTGEITFGSHTGGGGGGVDVDCSNIVDVSGIYFCNTTSLTTFSGEWLTVSGDLDLSSNTIQDVSGIFFKDGTYLGTGSSFDISSASTLKFSVQDKVDAMVLTTDGTLEMQGDMSVNDVSLVTLRFADGTSQSTALRTTFTVVMNVGFQTSSTGYLNWVPFNGTNERGPYSAGGGPGASVGNPPYAESALERCTFIAPYNGSFKRVCWRSETDFTSGGAPLKIALYSTPNDGGFASDEVPSAFSLVGTEYSNSSAISGDTTITHDPTNWNIVAGRLYGVRVGSYSTASIDTVMSFVVEYEP